LKEYQPGETPPKAMGGIILLFGAENVGKSRLPILSEDVHPKLSFLNFDRDASHLLAQRKQSYSYAAYSARDRAEAQVVLNNIDFDVAQAIKAPVDANGVRGVFAIDNGDKFWRIVKLAKLPEGDDDPPPKAYDDANTYIDDTLFKLERSGLWVIVTAPASEIWTRERAGSGEFAAKGWRGLKGHIIVEGYMYLNTKARGTMAVPLANTFNYTYNLYIRTAKKRPLVEGSVLENPTLRALLEKTKEVSREEK
jgi:hypothetical protein